MKEKNNVGIIIVIALVVLLGTIFVSIISTETVDKTTLTKVTEAVDISGARVDTVGTINDTYPLYLTHGCVGASQWRMDAGTCGLVVYSMANSSGDLRNTSDYTINATQATCSGLYAGYGDLLISDTEINNATIENTTYITYGYCESDYVSGWGATVANLVPGFFALAILIAGAFIIIYILRKEGVDIN